MRQKERESMPAEQAVSVVDDDDAVRSSICMLLRAMGLPRAPTPAVPPSWRICSEARVFARRRGDAGHEWP